MNIEISVVDYTNPKHATDLVFLLDSYAQDPMGGALPLAQTNKDKLVQSLSQIPHAFSIICYVDDNPAGLINCFETFSTFKCKPLINIHDVVLLAQFRELGISQLMMSKVESIAKEKGCCKITLEVLEGNTVARNAYIKFSFEGYELDPELGKAQFVEKHV